MRILDVGALLEGEPIYAPLLGNEGTELVGFEPQDEARHQLESLYAGRGVWFGHILGDGNRHSFYETGYPGCSSLFEPDAQVIDAFSTLSTKEGGNFETLSVSEVETVRLDDLPEVDGPDFTKLDVQGAELMILEHGMSKMQPALVIQTEASFFPLYKNQPLFAEQHLFLQKHGFELHKFIDVMGRSFKPFVSSVPTTPTSQLIEADAVFVRGLTDPDILSEDELLKAAYILNDVYHSYDLVHRLLEVRDGKSIIKLADIYLDEITKSQDRLHIQFLNLKI